ncbi:hypothetical protein FEAC_14840 [Ferrimicrobium acidiphilum DSM 19497]|uniref:Uncharacterized protein n=1 Tax=Ferrimicrobium acidiphilum DSM 19497 TaxID=1121877 RepID=A0A0D8FWP8_9ACTN|nr:hypothetical protein FEAC_14840 [Ferrimicrobium acidiphilum DSM 19497]
MTYVRGMSDRQRLFSSRAWDLHLERPSDAMPLEEQGATAQDLLHPLDLAGTLAHRDGFVVMYGSEVWGRVSECCEEPWLSDLTGGAVFPLALRVDNTGERRAVIHAPRLWPIEHYFSKPQVSVSKEADLDMFAHALLDLLPPGLNNATPGTPANFIQIFLSSYEQWEWEHVTANKDFPLWEDKPIDGINFTTVPGWREVAKELLFTPLLVLGPILLDAFYKAVFHEQEDQSPSLEPTYRDLLDRPGGYSLTRATRYNTDAPDSVLLYEVLGTLEDVLHLSRGPHSRYAIADFLETLEENVDGLLLKYVH